MEKPGGGVTHLKTFHSDELKIFSEGLRSIPEGQQNLIHGKGFW